MAAVALVASASLFMSNDDGNDGDEEQRLQLQQSTSMLLRIGTGYLCIARPLSSTLAVVCCDESGPMTRIIAFSFLMSIICNQFPKWLSAFVACGALFAFGLASRQLALTQSATKISTVGGDSNRSHDNNSGRNGLLRSAWSRLGLKERASLGGLAVVVSLLVENFIIWVVSATYKPGIDGSYEPLQDNGRTVLEGLTVRVFDVKEPWMAGRALQRLRNTLNVQWALVSSLGASFVCLELQLGQQRRRHGHQRQRQTFQQRTLAGLAFRATMTLAAARVVRTVSFALTVLPSQVKNCYRSHFPMPPAEWGAWLMVGFLPNTRGGCNDLILSGHATVTSTLACAFTSVANDGTFSTAVWTLVALDYAIEAYQGLHYSVDMWLGCIVTCLLWQLTKPLEFVEDNIEEQQRREETTAVMQPDENNVEREDFAMMKKQPAVPPSPPLDATTVCVYALPATLAFLVLTAAEAYINFFLVGFSAWACIIFARFGVTSLLQHILLCELCFGLGCYL